MSSQENRAVVRRFAERLSRGDLGAVDEFVTDDVVYHDGPPGLAPGIEGYRQLIGGYLAAFPDLRLTPLDMVAEGDKVVVRFTVGGTHRGELMGLAPTGRTMEANGTTILRFRGGKVAEEWEVVDMLGMMGQLGASPASAAPAG
jgi:steroid delta-isomerase-like uncharacterized protein